MKLKTILTKTKKKKTQSGTYELVLKTKRLNYKKKTTTI